MKTTELVFVKLGGSLITDKRREVTPRLDVIRALARELCAALHSNPGLQVLLGHGSGSFGHWEASRYDTRHGVNTQAGWQGFAQVGAAAARLNRIVVDLFLEEGASIISLQPAASALADAGAPIELALEPLRRALEAGLIPLIFGDVAFDRAWGGTILSTEDLFTYLVPRLRPTRILLLGNAPGVLDDNRAVIPTITPATYPQIAPYLHGSGGVDVTGGMADKVARMMALVQQTPGLSAHILTGIESGNLKRALLTPESAPGTRIYA